VSTDEVYGDRRGDDSAAIAGVTPLEPTNPYAASKAAAEMLVTSYVKSYALPCTIVRCNNVYGPRQHYTKVVAKFCTLALRGDELPLYDGGHARRHFVYVEDVVAALGLILRSCAGDGRAYNIAAEQEASAAELSRYVLELAGRSVASAKHVPGRPYDDQRYLVCDAELRAYGWRPRVSLKDGLAQTFRWYAQKHRDQGDRGSS
jgi:dTDP-D-glucose 4,6-dehydratase